MGWVKAVMCAGLMGLLMLGSVQAAPVEMVLPGLDGKDRRLSEFRGKWVVVNFWATWCPPCLDEMPELDTFHKAHKDKDAVVLAVNMEDIEVGALRRFLGRFGIAVPVVRMEPALDTPLGKVMAMPTTFLVNPQGEVVAREVGGVTAKGLEEAIERFRTAAGGKS